MLGTKEHYEVIEQFKRQFKHLRLDHEAKELWAKGHVFQDGKVDELFSVFLKGYAFGKSVEHMNAA